MTTGQTFTAADLAEDKKRGTYVKRLTQAWAELSGLDQYDATFHHEAQFERAIRQDHTITIRLVTNERGIRIVEVTDGTAWVSRDRC